MLAGQFNFFIRFFLTIYFVRLIVFIIFDILIFFRFCENKNEYTTIDEIVNKTNISLSEMKLFTIVRDPVERFLSGFVEKCTGWVKKEMNKAGAGITKLFCQFFCIVDAIFKK